MAPTPHLRSGRHLLALLVLVVGAYAVVIGLRLTPNLGLDLQGGTTVILTPELEGGAEVDAEQLAQAVDIIRNRVNGVGVAESEVVTQGDNIVISVPGEGRRVLQDLGSTAQLRFRPVLQVLPGGPGLGTPAADPPGSATAEPPGDPGAEPPAVPDEAGLPAGDAAVVPADPSAAPDRPRVVPDPALSAEAASPDATPTPTGAAPASPAPDPGAEPAVGPVLSGAPAPGDGRAQLQALDCTGPASRPVGGSPDRPEDQIVSCAQDGSAKYLLGPARVVGTDVAGAQARPPQGGTGVGTGWAVTVDFTRQGQERFTQLTQETVGQRVAIVLDGVTVSAPTIQQVIAGSPEITGSFDRQSASDLANILRFGALPLTFTTSQAESVSATLGGDQLEAGLFAGAIGLGLVVVYSVVWYRGLALVTVASLAVAGLLTYAAVAILGEAIGFTLTLAGVAGLIVSIGITADSFVVYFERVKDEVRSGSSVRSAVDRGWLRARRTIVNADVVQLLAAVVLYVLSVGAVRGFAFTLGLVTLIDVVVVFLFTRPLVSLAGRSRVLSRPWFLPLAPRSRAGGSRRGPGSLPSPVEA